MRHPRGAGGPGERSNRVLVLECRGPAVENRGALSIAGPVAMEVPAEMPARTPEPGRVLQTLYFCNQTPETGISLRKGCVLCHKACVVVL